jgi:hypothetical protein
MPEVFLFLACEIGLFQEGMTARWWPMLSLRMPVSIW